MADETPAVENAAPQMVVLSQYVRDLNFENSAAKEGLNPSGKPSINVQVNVDATPIADDRFLVSLKTDVAAAAEDANAFRIGLDYVGAFQIANIPQDALQPVLLIEAPRMLFPFARRIIADLSRDGGFPPLMLDPIDFTSLYRRQMEQAQQAQDAV